MSNENDATVGATQTATATTTSTNQYRATRIWHEIIESFEANLPLKRHWRNFRTYQDCFTSNEAIEYLFRYLKTSPNFKSKTKIQRQQAIQLLQIFLNENIIEDVRGSKYNLKQFQDDDRLYKFCSHDKHKIGHRKTTAVTSSSHQTSSSTSCTSISSTATTTTTSSSDSQSETQLQQQQPQLTSTSSSTLHVVSQTTASKTKTKLIVNNDENKENEEDKKNERECGGDDDDGMWLKQSVELINRLLDHKDQLINDVLMQLNINNLKYNTKYINKHGVVILTSSSLNTDPQQQQRQQQDLPSWLMQAMTSLVHYEDYNKTQFTSNTANQVQQHVQVKPSFLDIFNEIKNYFHQNDAGNATASVATSTLITDDIGKLLVHIMKYIYERDGNGGHREDKEEEPSHDCDGNGDEDKCCSQCLNTYDFLNTWLDCNAIEFNEFFLNLNINYDDPDEMNEEDTSAQCLVEPSMYMMDDCIEMIESTMMTGTGMGTAINYDYDEIDDYDQLDVDEPEYEQTQDWLNNPLLHTHIGNAGAGAVAGGQSKIKKLHRNNSFIAAIRSDTAPAVSSSSSSSSCIGTTGHHHAFPSNKPMTTSTASLSARPHVKANRSQVKSMMMMNTTTTSQLSKTQSMDFIVNVLNGCVPASNATTARNATCLKRRTPSFHTVYHYQQQQRQQQAVSSSCSSNRVNLNKDSIDLIINIYRILLQYLPPINKRKLHLLLRLLYKLKQSQYSNLFLLNNNSNNQDIESFLINSFSKCIIKSPAVDVHGNGIKAHGDYAYKICSILINNYSDIMRIPQDLVDLIQQEQHNRMDTTLKAKSTHLRRQHHHQPLTAVKRDENNANGNNKDDDLIKSLLNILTNTNLTSSDKYTRLKHFKETHPDVYEQKYSTIKKAINILGLNHNDDTMTQQRSRSNKNSTMTSTAMATAVIKGQMAKTTTMRRSSNKRTITNSATVMATSNTTILNANGNNATNLINNLPKFLIPKAFKK